MPALSRISARIYNTPLLVRPDVAETISANLGARLAGLSPPIKAGLFDAANDAESEPYKVENGVATLEIRGELVNRGSWLDAESGLKSYDSIKSALRQAAADPRVVRLVLDIDSPGGEAAGAMETADEIAALNAVKPVTAFVNSLAASAAYWLASGAGEIVMTPMASVGSIGVVWLHMDHSAALAAEGVKPTLLHAGAYKVDGNPLQPLGKEARARIQGQIDEVYGLFTASVGARRPKLGEDGARATEAAILMGEKAVAAGLADRIASTPLAAPKARKAKEFLMSAVAPEPLDVPLAAPVVTTSTGESTTAQAQEAAMAEAQALEAARNEGAIEAAARISAILDSEAAKGREALAKHFAFQTALPVEAALAALGVAPVSAPPKPESRMASVPNPALRPDSSQRPDDPQADADAAWTALATKLNSAAGFKSARA